MKMLLFGMVLSVALLAGCGDSLTDTGSTPDIVFVPVTAARSYVGIVSDDAPTAEIATTQEQLTALWKQHFDEDTSPQLPEGHTFLFVWSPRELLDVSGVGSGTDGVVVLSGSVTWSDVESCRTIAERIASPAPWVTVVDVGEQLRGEVRLEVHQIKRRWKVRC